VVNAKRWRKGKWAGCGAAFDKTLALDALAPALGLPEHPDQHRPERPVLLAVDQELGEGCAGFGVPREEPIDRPTRRQDWTLSQRGQVLALALYHQHWLWISFPRG
jgi:hypothetical protein